MDNKCTAQIFVGGAWRDAAVISLAGPEHQGWRTPTYTTYLPDYALDYLGRRDAAAWGEIVLAHAAHAAGRPGGTVERHGPNLSMGRDNEWETQFTKPARQGENEPAPRSIMALLCHKTIIMTDNMVI